LDAFFRRKRKEGTTYKVRGPEAVYSPTKNDHRRFFRKRTPVCIIAILGEDKTLVYNARDHVSGQPLKKIIHGLYHNPL
jgi:hypothetical protein